MTNNISTTQNNSKQNLRIWAKNARICENFELLNKQILENIKKTNTYKNAHYIMIFYPLSGEINLLPLLKDSKEFSFPCIKEDKIVPYKNGTAFCEGKFKVQEPLNTPKQDISALDLIIVPALCVDKNGYRLGYGKGYYDKFIKTLNREKTKLLTPVWNNMIIDNIPTDTFDEKIDYIVTENQIIKI